MTALDLPRPEAAAERAKSIGAEPPLREIPGPRRWAQGLTTGGVAATLGLAGLVVFAVAYSYQRAFYGTFSLAPEAAGQGYAEVVAKAATGGLALWGLIGTAAAGPVAAMTWSALRQPRLAWRGAWRTLVGGAVSTAAAWIAFVVAGQAPFSAVPVAWPLGVLGAALALTTHSCSPGRNAGGQGRRWLPAVAVLLLLALLRAWDMGDDDARRLLTVGDARPHASLWQFVVGVPTPAVTITWTEPGQAQLRQAPARLLRGDGDLLVVFDLKDCLLRRLPVGSATMTSRIATDSGAPSTLPRCPA